MRSYTRHIGVITALSVLVLLTLTSCGDPSVRSAKALYGKAVPLSKAMEANNINPDIVRLLDLASAVTDFAARNYGLSDEAGQMRYLRGSREHLAWRMVITDKDSVTASDIRYFIEKSVADERSQKIEADGLAFIIEPYESLSWAGGQPSPVIDAFAAWPYERLVEWVFFELFSAARSGAKNGKGLEGFPGFAAEKATVRFLEEKLSPSSPVLARYVSRCRDARTFAVLYEDYRTRFVDLYAQDPLPADTEKRRQMLSATWLAEYRSSYQGRFITNEYVAFGTTGASDIELASWENRYLGWKRWEKAFAASGQEAAAFIISTLQR